jgi:HAMP domain-containing protein
VGRLTESFNSMARSLQENRDELESQNAELEMQTVELESRQSELAEAGDELRAQRDELEATAALLAERSGSPSSSATSAERLAAETDPRALAAIALDKLAEVTGADVGALFAARRETVEYWSSLPCAGWPTAPWPRRVARGGEGAAARAVAERGPVGVEGSGLRVHTLGGESDRAGGAARAAPARLARGRPWSRSAGSARRASAASTSASCGGSPGTRPWRWPRSLRRRGALARAGQQGGAGLRARGHRPVRPATGA